MTRRYETTGRRFALSFDNDKGLLRLLPLQFAVTMLSIEADGLAFMSHHRNVNAEQQHALRFFVRSFVGIAQNWHVKNKCGNKQINQFSPFKLIK